MYSRSSNAADFTTWNGAVCPTCIARYVGHHVCTKADLARRIAELARAMEVAPSQAAEFRPVDRTAGCPCRRENGGSGVCSCVLGNQITCSI